jgi:hypothetical protein
MATSRPRNVLVGPDGVVLIDWEWAGLYPEGYEVAFFWYVLADLPNARKTVEAKIRPIPGSSGFGLAHPALAPRVRHS